MAMFYSFHCYSHSSFYNCPCTYLYWDLYFSTEFQGPFISSTGHFLQGRSHGHDPPQILFFWECLHFSLTFVGQFCQIWGFWLIGFFFFLLAFQIRQATASSPKVSDEKSTDKLTDDPLHVLSHSSCRSPDTLSFSSWIILFLTVGV